MERMKKFTTSLLIIIFLLSIFFVIHPIETCKAEVNTLHVGSDYDYQSIQDAIDIANESDIIHIHSGTYNENIVIDKSVTIIGDSKTDTIINGNSNNHVIKITANFVNISELTIQNAIGSGYDGIMLDKADYCNIQNNIIQESNDAGVSLFDSHSNTIADNTIKNNEEYGISLSYSDSNIISNNQLYYNENGLDIGSYSDDNEIYDNNILGKHGELKGTGLNTRPNTNSNTIYKNKFNSFYQNAKDQGSNNVWYKSSSQEGNYWDDYAGQESEQGYGTISYNIGGDVDSQDIYPLGYFLNPVAPTAEIVMVSPNPAYVGKTIYFKGHATDDGSIIELEWKIGGSVIGHSEDFEYSGLSQGTYTVSFRVKDNDGEWSSWDVYEQTLSVIPESSGDQNQKPVAKIITVSPSTVNYGEQVFFNGNGTDDGGITIYYWNSTIDGYLSGVPSFYKSDSSVGEHTITFKVRDNEGRWSSEDSWTLTILVNQSTSNTPPVAKADGPYTAYINETINLSGASSYDPDGEILSYLWTFGDGETALGIESSHIYSSAGEYTVTLTVTDNKGGVSTNTTIANIYVQSVDDNGEDDGIPGFEIILILASIGLIVIIGKIKTRKK